MVAIDYCLILFADDNGRSKDGSSQPNFNNLLGSWEDRDPNNGRLDQGWSTDGGCGWQTKAPGTCSNDANRPCYGHEDCASPGTCTGGPPATGGAWHTGLIGPAGVGNCLGDCTGDGITGGPDVIRVSQEFGNSVGPSGITNPSRDLNECPIPGP